jgi:hypothetical protein
VRTCRLFPSFLKGELTKYSPSGEQAISETYYMSLLPNVLLTESGPLLIDQRVILLIQIGHSRVVWLILGAKRHAA